MSQEVYRRALEVMIKRGGPYRGKDIPEFFTMMRELFTPDQMAINNIMSKKPETAGAIAERAGRPAEEVRDLLETMADAGLCMTFPKGDTRYFMGAPFMPGIFEFQFLPGKTSERDKKIAHLIKDYKTAYKAAGQPRPMTFAGARVIPVDRTIEAGNQIHTYSQVATYIEKNDPVVVGNCYCRHAALLRGEDTHGMPMEVCMWFGPLALFALERLGGRRVDKAEALELLKSCEEAGLIHMSRNTTEEVDFICNCDRWHCEVVTDVLQQPKPALFFNSGYEPVFDAEACVACGACVERCPASALELGEDGPPALDLARCFGCAVCATGCPEEAVSMAAKPGFPAPPRDIKGLAEAARASRGM